MTNSQLGTGGARKRTRRRWLLLMALDDKRRKDIERQSGKTVDEMDDDELETAVQDLSGKVED